MQRHSPRDRNNELAWCTLKDVKINNSKEVPIMSTVKPSKKTNSDNGFFKMPNWIFKFQLSPVAFYVYSYLLRCNNPQNGCYPSKRTIANACGIAVSSVSRAIEILEEERLIERKHCAPSRIDGQLVIRV